MTARRPQRKTAAETAPAIEIGLNAAIVAVSGDAPLILAVGGGEGLDMLPYGPFDPLAHRTMEIGLRSWVSDQTGLELGYVEQLYTFGDRGRHTAADDGGPHLVSIGYLALTRIGDDFKRRPDGTGWRSWYSYFPWEDWRNGKPSILETEIEPALRRWAGEDGTDLSRDARAMRRLDRVRLWFGIDGIAWDEERALERYELLYEAGLVHEAARDGRVKVSGAAMPALGQAMARDHRRILATAISRLRAKIKYRPVIFEMMPPSFTLLELQRTVEALLGLHLHKQNFRRLIEKRGLVQPTGTVTTRTGGRPAQLYRFHREVLRERPSPGFRL